MSLESLQQKEFIIIDDDEMTLFYSTAVIKRFFYYNNVISFKQSSKAVEYFHNVFSLHPKETLVLLDINMPGLTGWGVLDKIQNLQKDVQEKLSIIFVSLFIDDEAKIKSSVNSLVIGYIEKPLSIKKLKDLMELREATAKKLVYH